MAKSDLEDKFLLLWNSTYPDLPPIREFKFLPDRRFRWDFCWVDKKVAVEIQGGAWFKGAHSSGVGINRDCEKNNLAVLDGWRVFKFTVNHLRDTPKESLALVYSVLTSPT